MHHWHMSSEKLRYLEYIKALLVHVWNVNKKFYLAWVKKLKSFRLNTCTDSDEFKD